MDQQIAKLHSEPNLRFFRWLRLFAKCLWPRGYVTLQKIEPTKKSSNFAREESFAIPSMKIRNLSLILPIVGSCLFAEEAAEPNMAHVSEAFGHIIHRNFSILNVP